MVVAQVVSSICVICIFILSGLGLKTDDIKTALVQWKAIIYAFLSINFMTGCAALVMMQLPFVPQELAIGLAVFCSMPTTLSSGATLVRSLPHLSLVHLSPALVTYTWLKLQVDQAGGNVALALLLTAGTNLLGIFTIPFLLKFYLSTKLDIKINPCVFETSDNVLYCRRLCFLCLLSMMMNCCPVGFPC